MKFNQGLPNGVFNQLTVGGRKLFAIGERLRRVLALLMKSFGQLTVWGWCLGEQEVENVRLVGGNRKSA